MAPSAPYTRDWGVPDWRNAGEYFRYAEMDFATLRWEFLRRHPAYRAAWNEANVNKVGLSIDWEREFGLTVPWDPTRADGPRFFDLDVVEAPFMGIDGEITGAVGEFVRQAHDRGCLLAMWDPGLRPEDNLELISASARRWMTENDVKIPTERVHKKKASSYLRIIDARDAGISPVEIADILYDIDDNRQNDVDNIHKLYRRARETMEKVTGVKLITFRNDKKFLKRP